MRNVFKLFASHYSKWSKLIAFTLAEVVLVMGIIGVVGVLAVSNAKKDTDTAEKVAQLRKTYDILNTAMSQAVMENGAVKTWGTNGAAATSAEMWAVVSPYLKLLKNCGTGTGCWKDNFDTNTSFYKAILANGTSIAIRSYNSYDSEIEVFVDVNGKKGLQMQGNDIFKFFVYSDGRVKPENGLGDDLSGYYSTAWVIRFGNMDYLKSCADSLSWTGDHTCR